MNEKTLTCGTANRAQEPKVPFRDMIDALEGQQSNLTQMINEVSLRLYGQEFKTIYEDAQCYGERLDRIVKINDQMLNKMNEILVNL